MRWPLNCTNVMFDTVQCLRYIWYTQCFVFRWLRYVIILTDFISRLGATLAIEPGTFRKPS